ncbi:hypothetical protein HDZ31DRAFT_63278 [Schizophyllum fasciatum]
MFPELVFFAFVLPFGLAAWSGKETPYSPNGDWFECGHAVNNNDYSVFVAPVHFVAANCGKPVKVVGGGKTLYPKLGGVYRCAGTCGQDDIQVTPDVWAAQSSGSPGAPFVLVTWEY